MKDSGATVCSLRVKKLLISNTISNVSFEDLDKELADAKNRDELSLIEVKCSIGARDDLGRPTTTALENKVNFMEYLKTIK